MHSSEVRLGTEWLRLWSVCVAAYFERAVLHPRLRAHIRGVQALAVSDIRGQPSQGRASRLRMEMSGMIWTVGTVVLAVFGCFGSAFGSRVVGLCAEEP